MHLLNVIENTKNIDEYKNSSYIFKNFETFLKLLSLIDYNLNIKKRKINFKKKVRENNDITSNI